MSMDKIPNKSAEVCEQPKSSRRVAQPASNHLPFSTVCMHAVLILEMAEFFVAIWLHQHRSLTVFRSWETTIRVTFCGKAWHFSTIQYSIIVPILCTYLVYRYVYIEIFNIWHEVIKYFYVYRSPKPMPQERLLNDAQRSEASRKLEPVDM